MDMQNQQGPPIPMEMMLAMAGKGATAAPIPPEMMGQTPVQPGMGMAPPMMDPGMAPVPGDMTAMQSPDVQGGMGMAGMPGAVDALAGMLDQQAAQELMMRQQAERDMLAQSLQQEMVAAAKVLIDRARMMGESIDQPGGPVAGVGMQMPQQSPAAMPMPPGGDMAAGGDAMGGPYMSDGMY